MIQAELMVAQVAHELEIPTDEVIVRGLRALIERDLRQLEAKIFEITGRYQVRSVAEMNARYETGTLEESGSWRDYQRLDHLEYKRDRLSDLLKASFPSHFHNGAEDVVEASDLPASPIDATRAFLRFAREHMQGEVP